MDVKVCYTIGNLVEKMSTAGSIELDTKLYKELVNYAGQSEEYIKFCLEKLIQQMERKHSEIRLGAFLIIDELFRKSEYFREILLDRFHLLLELTIESNPKKLLPPPLSAAKKLKQRVLQSIHTWNLLFAAEHKRIQLAYNFIKHSLKVDFDDALKRSALELQREAMERERKTKVMQIKLDALKIEMDDNVEEISRIVTEMNNCFCLLIPKPEDLFNAYDNQNDSNTNDNESSELDLREHGFTAPTTVIPLDLDSKSNIKRTDDNSAIIDNLKDYYAILRNRLFPMVKKWIQIASKAEDDSTFFRKTMDLKDMIQAEMTRFEELEISSSEIGALDDSSESDEDFEEVPEKEGYEENVVAPPVPQTSSSSTPKIVSAINKSSAAATSGGWSLWADDNNPNDPTSRCATVSKLMESSSHKQTLKDKSVSKLSDNEVSSSSVQHRKEKLLQAAPKLPFDIDLLHWEEENLKAPSVEVCREDGHRFWQPSDREGEVIEAPDGVASLRTRVIEFSGTFEPVKWSCRAALASGKLCPRKDRNKCPFHGKIIARDCMGNPTIPEDIAALAAEKEKEEREKPPDWQDPEFLKDIQAATGMDLTIRPPKRGKKKKSFAELYPQLTDLGKRKKEPRSRIEKIVLNKGSLKRVAETMDSLNYKRYKDKFGDQWNYSMNE